MNPLDWIRAAWAAWKAFRSLSPLEWAALAGVGVYALRMTLNSPPNSIGHLVAVMFDDLVSVVIWRQPGITISSEIGERKIDGKRWAVAGDWILTRLNKASPPVPPLGPSHCYSAILADYQRAQAVVTRLQQSINIIDRKAP